METNVTLAKEKIKLLIFVIVAGLTEKSVINTVKKKNKYHFS